MLEGIEKDRHFVGEFLLDGEIFPGEIIITANVESFG